MSTERTAGQTGATDISTGGSARAKHSGTKKSKGRRRHRAQYPTPEFYIFAFILNIAVVAIAAWLLAYNPVNIPLLATGLLGVLGLGIAAYSITLRPKESNKKFRKILITLVAVFGFTLLVVHAVNIFLSPANFVLPI